MGILVTKSDFVGKYSLVKSINDKIDVFIEEYEEQILVDLLGQDLFDLFQNDLVAKVPQTDIYLAIYNKFTEYDNNFAYTSTGMKKLVLSLIYFEMSRDNSQKNTQVGTVKNVTEVSESLSPTYLFKIYNEGIKNYKAIQRYILDNLSDYPDFKGIVKNFTSPY